MKKKILYLDCSSGVSGDMCLGALIDCGVPLDELTGALEGLKVGGYRIEKREVKRAGLRGCKIDIEIRDDTKRRHLADIKRIIEGSELRDELKERSLEAFRRLFEAEARVHGSEPERIHLHELSAIDCLIDITGTLFCLDYLSVDLALSSPVNLGGGFVRTEHGRLPVPAPATLELLRGWPVYSRGIKYELTTPTGAVILSTAFRPSEEIPLMRIESIGYGAGSKEIEAQPNILRAMLGYEDRGRDVTERVVHIETNIDDMNPQVYEYIMERLFQEGALDVYLTPIIMKKSRPGTVLNVLCPESEVELLSSIILSESTTIGLRYHRMDRICLERSIREIETEWGSVRFKVLKTPEGIKISPEYEDCKKIALREGLPILHVMKILSRVAEETVL